MPLHATTEDFSSWMKASGYSKSTIASRKGALKALAAVWPEAIDTEDFGTPAYAAAFETAAKALPDWQSHHLNSLPKLLALLAADRADMAKVREFDFFEVNPGISAFGFGAERAGGKPSGAELVTPKAHATFEDFHGFGSISQPETTPGLILVNLPFSAFTTFGEGDPETKAVMAAAAKHGRGNTPLLFRVEWTAGQRMELAPSAYADLVSHWLPGHECRHAVVANEAFIPMEGFELFIGAAKSWQSEFRPVAVDPGRLPAASYVSSATHLGWASVPDSVEGRRFPAETAGRIDSGYMHDPRAALVMSEKGQRMMFPLEILSLLGFPSNFNVPWDPDTSYHLLGDSVAVPVAERAVRGFLRALGM